MNTWLAPTLLGLAALSVTALLIYNDRRQRASIKLLAARADKTAKVIEDFTELLHRRREARAQAEQSAVTEQPVMLEETTPAPPRKVRGPGRRGRKFGVCHRFPEFPGDAKISRKLRFLRRDMRAVTKKTFFEHVDLDVARDAMGFEAPDLCPIKDPYFRAFRSQWEGRPAYFAILPGNYFIFTQEAK